MSYLVPHSPKQEIKITHNGLLKNKKFVVKDMCDIKDVRCSCGNPDFYNLNQPSKIYAPFLKKILNEGAILKGITICDEFFYSIIGENSYYGTPENKNAPGSIPGGSSSGSAAALTQSNYDFSIGSDKSGSARATSLFLIHISSEIIFDLPETITKNSSCNSSDE